MLLGLGFGWGQKKKNNYQIWDFSKCWNITSGFHCIFATGRIQKKLHNSIKILQTDLPLYKVNCYWYDIHNTDIFK
jgi:hypothetical protein